MKATTELVVVEGAAAEKIRNLARTARAALSQSRTAPPGATRELRRFEDALAAIESIGRQQALAGARVIEVAVDDGLHGTVAVTAAELDDLTEVPGRDGELGDAIEAGAVVVELRSPFGTGVPAARRVARDVAARWSSDASGITAVEERFRHLVREAAQGTVGAAIVACGVPNRVVTETLREFVFAEGEPTSAAVHYRDGSDGEPFPLYSMRPAPTATKADIQLDVALMSIRHAELDADVDGAWLRNVHVSSGQTHGDIDRFVHQRSREQLAKLTRHGTVALGVFQTGFAPAVVGFYRAVAEHLREHPGTVAVRPKYFREQGGYVSGTAWEAM